MDGRVYVLGEGVRPVFCAWRGVRHHHVVPVWHQLAGFHGKSGQYRRAVAGIRGADGVFPGSGFPWHHAVWGKPRAGMGAYLGHVPCGLWHNDVGVLDHRSEFVDAYACWVRIARWCGVCDRLVGDHLQPVDAVPIGAYAAGIRPDGGVFDHRCVGLPPPDWRQNSRCCLDSAVRFCACGGADPDTDFRRRHARVEHAGTSAAESGGDGRQLGNRAEQATAAVCGA